MSTSEIIPPSCATSSFKSDSNTLVLSIKMFPSISPWAKTWGGGGGGKGGRQILIFKLVYFCRCHFGMTTIPEYSLVPIDNLKRM